MFPVDGTRCTLPPRFNMHLMVHLVLYMYNLLSIWLLDQNALLHSRNQQRIIQKTIILTHIDISQETVSNQQKLQIRKYFYTC